MAGLALLGVAVGAALVGLVTISSGPRDGDGGDAIGTTTATETTQIQTETPAPTGTETPVTQTGPPPGEQGATPSPTTPAAPPTTTTTAPAPPAPPLPTAPVRVYNNSTITGLAARAASDFSNAGWPVEEVANYRGRIPTSTVYYQPGTGQEAAAQRLANQFELRVEPRFSGIEGASPGLIVIVTNDYGSK
jgi:hypothetical protein